ncbi:MAG TPA: acyl-CoA dehydrogenase C-terminal domain-containing protein, partial [Steroidobacteraceae bacterium]|nr:acyl-CoA dehydrogenase C-terminal domain-containing protein [Steroidobacteraceae bacterium]
MSTYRAPLAELQFVINDLIGLQSLAGCGELADYSAEVAASVLEEAARFAQDVLDPLNRPGDQHGARWSESGVSTAPGFREAYRQFVEAGWPQLGGSADYGGQSAPRMLTTAVQEIWASANLAFKLCPMLTHGAAHALELTGSAEQKQRYLPAMTRGEWSGTMVLTEPHAGSDLGLIRTRAVPEGDHYRLFGQKIFITWGEHDYTPNIIHMVLARIEGAPAGTRGISLFIVPKVLVRADGTLGERNDVRCVSIEHKLGIHASPTCVMAFGERAGAVGYLVGEANRGLEYMFIMMNGARLSVGLEGYALTERAFQHALEWARNRQQGRSPSGREGPVPIIEHADVKRMLLSMKSGAEAMRALSSYAACQLDIAEHHRDPAARAAAQARGDLLIPIVKGWSTELGIEAASIGIQVHGGMGFIEETGAAQYLRDVRITAIYEGTTGIQANDLIGRKIARDSGHALTELCDLAQRELEHLSGGAPVQPVRAAALEALQQLRAATDALLSLARAQPVQAAAVAVPFLKLCGFTLGGWLMARAAALAATRLTGPDRDFYAAKLRSARFYAEQLLPQTLALARIVERGGASVAETEP